MATFKLTTANGVLQTVAGVLSPAPVSVATIPVDDDVGLNRMTGYAVANTSSSEITLILPKANSSGWLS